MSLLVETQKSVTETKLKLKKAEQEITTLQGTVSVSPGFLISFTILINIEKAIFLNSAAETKKTKV